MEFVKKHVIDLDFNRAVFTVSSGVPPQVQTNGWRIPMKLWNIRHFRLPTLINGKVIIDLLLDTSDSSTISLKKEDWDLVFPPRENAPVHKLLVVGINKKVTESVLARLPTIEVQSKRYSNVVCVLNPYDTAPSSSWSP